ncbi:MAG: DVU0298 family protein [Gemmatimonadota bacterium]
MSAKRLRNQVRIFLVDGDLEAVEELATEERQVLASLIALTFDPDPEVVWRAIEAMGMVAARLAPTHKAYLKEHMRRLYWLITEESGAVFWRSPECMAECAFRAPDLFQSHIPIAFHLLETLEEEDLEHFRPGAIWAIARLHSLARDHLPTVLPLVVAALDSPDVQSRGLAAWCLGEVGEAAALEERPDLLEDPGPVQVYRNRKVEETTVGRLTREALEEADRQA